MRKQTDTDVKIFSLPGPKFPMGARRARSSSAASSFQRSIKQSGIQRIRSRDNEAASNGSLGDLGNLMWSPRRGRRREVPRPPYQDDPASRLVDLLHGTANLAGPPELPIWQGNCRSTGHRRWARRLRGPRRCAARSRPWAASSWYAIACRPTRNPLERCRCGLRSPSTRRSSARLLLDSGSTPWVSFGRSPGSVKASWSTPRAPGPSPASGPRYDGYLHSRGQSWASGGTWRGSCGARRR